MEKGNEIDIEQFITCVFLKPAIWDKRQKDHSNRNCVEKSWHEISVEMKVQGEF